MAKNKDKEELTTAMHDELNVSKEIDQKHATFTALDLIKQGTFNNQKAMMEYGITDADIIRYKKEWEELNSD